MIFSDPANDMPSLEHKHKYKHKNKTPFALLAVVAAMAILPACSTVSVNKQPSEKTIAAQRGNIVTDNKLSSDTASVLLSAGLSEFSKPITTPASAANLAVFRNMAAIGP